MAITFNGKSNLCQFIYTYNGSAYSSNYYNTAAWDYFANNFAVNHAIYFGSSIYQTTERFRGITLRIGTAIAATSYTAAWEYYNGSAWVALTCTDNSNSISLTGDREVTFEPPDNWSKNTINGQVAYWIRLRVTAVNTPTEGGANSANSVVGHEDAIVFDASYDNGTSSGSNDATHLNDTAKSWTSAAIGRAIRVMSGTGAGQVRWITAQTATQLTVERAWDTIPDNTSTYRIAYTLQDIYDADVAGGWGKVTKVNDYVYIFNTSLRASTSGFLGALDSFIMFGKNLIINIGSSQTGLFLGQRFNSTDPYGYHGCAMYFQHSGYAYRSIVLGAMSELYASYFKIIGTTSTNATRSSLTNAALRIWNCTFENFRSGMAPTNTANDVCKRITTINGYFGLEGAAVPSASDILIVKTDSSPIMLGQPNTDKNLSDTQVALGAGSNDIGTWDLDVNAYIDDSPNLREISGDIWGTTGNLGTIWQRFSTLNTLKIVDEAGNALNGATVIVKNAAETEVINATTGADGKLTSPAKLIYKQHTTPNDSTTTTTSHTPHTLEVRKAGYNSVRNVSFDCSTDNLGDLVLTRNKVLNLTSKVKISS